MKVLNDLHEAIRKDRAQRRIYRALHDLSAHVLRDIGVEVDHDRRRGHRP